MLRRQLQVDLAPRGLELPQVDLVLRLEVLEPQRHQRACLELLLRPQVVCLAVPPQQVEAVQKLPLIKQLHVKMVLQVSPCKLLLQCQHMNPNLLKN